MDKEKLLEKWLVNELTEAELNEFKKLKDFNLNTEIIEGAKQFKASQFSTVKSFDELKENLTKTETPIFKLNIYKVLFRVAAMLVVSLGIYFSFFFNNLTTVQTLASQKTNFELPDASSVTLNAGSKVKYSKKKWSTKRELTLNGEAFFKVAKGSKFDVKTSDGIVSVLGTQFTVKQRDAYFEVICFEGIVSVNSKGKSHKLTKGNTFRILNNVVTTDIIKNNKPPWIDNISTFKSVPLQKVLEEFERQYNVVIASKDVDTKRLFTGGFVHTNLEEALASITIPFNLSFKKNNSNNIELFKIQQ
jgi:ferric-dicitrate binding protein FerR (iron transport regulator)